MTARLIDGCDLTDISADNWARSGSDYDPSGDLGLNAFAFDRGATHISVETGNLYKVGADGCVSFFKREQCGEMREIPSSCEAFEIASAGFTRLANLGRRCASSE